MPAYPTPKSVARDIAKFGWFGPRRRSTLLIEGKGTDELSSGDEIVLPPPGTAPPKGPKPTGPVGFVDLSSSSTTGNGSSEDDTGDSQIVSVVR